MGRSLPGELSLGWTCLAFRGPSCFDQLVVCTNLQDAPWKTIRTSPGGAPTSLRPRGRTGIIGGNGADGRAEDWPLCVANGVRTS